jgi:2-oxo-4-hydroxy-4-carboxy--5-ureidoimidazoline (OHCU) decarboxylase
MVKKQESWESKREALFERPLAQSPLLSFAIAEAQLAVKVSLHIQLGENSRRERAVGGGDQINQQDQRSFTSKHTQHNRNRGRARMKPPVVPI